jgi:hypothetical protein
MTCLKGAASRWFGWSGRQPDALFQCGRRGKRQWPRDVQIGQRQASVCDTIGVCLADNSKAAAHAICRHHLAGGPDAGEQMRQSEAPATAKVENPATILDRREGSNPRVEVSRFPLRVQGAHDPASAAYPQQMTINSMPRRDTTAPTTERKT